MCTDGWYDNMLEQLDTERIYLFLFTVLAADSRVARRTQARERVRAVQARAAIDARR